MKRNDIRFGIGPRGGYRVAIVEVNQNGSFKKHLIPSINSLSLGESILLNLFINIIRHSDNPPKSFNEIKGIVIIDEVDVHLHTNLQTEGLPLLVKLFPKVQFIFTTHSPLFLLGMRNILGEDSIEIRSMPTGEIISTERFSEFQHAYEVFKDTSRHDTEIKEHLLHLNKPVLFVEGSIDIEYIKKAADHLGKTDVLSKIKITEANGFGGLDQIWRHYNTKLSEILPQKILLLYDCDTQKSNEKKGNIFKKVIPFESSNLIKCGIENLFPVAIIQDARNFKMKFIDYTESYKKELRGKTEVIPESYEINKDEKSNLCKWICQNGKKEDFIKFDIIFSMIEGSLLNS